MHELTRFPDDALLNATAALSARDHRTTAALVAHLAEIDARRLYLALGHPSMFAYVVETLHYSESAAYRRIQAARMARRFPRLLDLLAEARLHLAAVCLIAPHLAGDNFDELVEAASRQPKAKLERWLQVRFAPPLLVAAGTEPAAEPAQLSPGRVETELAPQRVEPQLAPGRVAPPAAAPAVAPHVILRLALPPAMEARLRYAQQLLGHAVPGGDPVEVFGRALEALIREQERRKFARAERPRQATKAAKRQRTVPAHVKREVWKRDQGRCAFVSMRGQRCSARVRLEFDHRVPVARGGTARTDDVRLLCRAHNQFEAERVFGRDFMRRKREAARSTRPGESCGAVSSAEGDRPGP